MILFPYLPASKFDIDCLISDLQESKTGAGKRGKNRKREEQINVLNICHYLLGIYQ